MERRLNSAFQAQRDVTRKPRASDQRERRPGSRSLPIGKALKGRNSICPAPSGLSFAAHRNPGRRGSEADPLCPGLSSDGPSGQSANFNLSPNNHAPQARTIGSACACGKTFIGRAKMLGEIARAFESAAGPRDESASRGTRPRWDRDSRAWLGTAAVRRIGRRPC